MRTTQTSSTPRSKPYATCSATASSSTAAGYAFCSDAINKRVLGASAREIKVRRGLPAKASTRDALEPHELAALRFAEAMAEKSIKDGCAHGNTACCGVCDRAGRVVRQAIDALSTPLCA